MEVPVKKLVFRQKLAFRYKSHLTFDVNNIKRQLSRQIYMILRLKYIVNGFSILNPLLPFVPASIYKQRVVSLCCKSNFTNCIIMPPKRKLTKTDVEAVVDVTEEVIPAKQKRGRKAKDVSEINGIHEENLEEAPKRGKRAKKTEGEETKQLKSEKPKRAARTKVTTDTPTSSEEVETAKKSKRALKTPTEEKPIKKTRKASSKPVEENGKDESVKVKSNRKGKKTTEHTKEENIEEQNDEEKPVEVKSERKGRKKPSEPINDDDSNKKVKKTAKSKKTPDEKIIENGEAKKPKVLLNKTASDWNSIDFTCNKKNGYDVSHNLIISTWNIGGVKSWVNKGCMEYITHESPDILCVQETKCNTSKLPDEVKQLSLYKQYWCSSKKEGYAGVGILTIKEPKNVTYGIGDDEQDEDGRCITAEYDGFYLVNVYVPNAGRKLVTLPKRLDWNESFMKYIKELDKKKPVIICGDMNVSHQAVDLARPQNNTKNAGFTPEERQGMTDFLNEGFVDVYRHLYPNEKDMYSFWTYMANARSKNIGWRLDYFIVSERLIKGVCDAKYRTQVLGSDHCPVTLFINV